MKRFAIVCAFVLLLNVLCPVGHMHAEEISTPTDVECEHPRRHEGGYQSDDTHHWYACPDCGEKVDVLEHNDKCYPEGAGVCNDCKRTDVTFGFTGHGYIDMDAYGSDTYTHWNVCEACGEKLNVNYHVGTAGGDCTVCGAPYACAHAYGQYDGDDTYHWFVCDSCGESVNKEVHDAKPGDVGDNCTVCGAYIVCNHTNKSEWHYDAMTHWKECIDCGFVVDELGHDNWANCSVCGYACEHENMDWEHNETQHWKECTLCGYQENAYSHRTDCQNKGVCYDCGATFAYNEDDVMHTTSGNIKYEWDEYQHYNVCINCGQAVWGEAHMSMETPGICFYCGASFADCENGVHGVMGRFYDETHHWFGCEKCEAVLGDYTEHFVLCAQTDLTKCQTCDATVDPTKVEMQHASSDEGWVAVDAYTHRSTCVCGEETEEWGHSKYCQADVCEYCGYDGELLNGGVYHNFDGKYEYDEYFHWGVCVDCGEGENIQAAHIQQDCKSDICQVCGATFDNNQHYGYTDEYEYDENGHWFTCTDCGEKTEPQGHMYVCDEPNGCTTCGYKPSGTVNVSHWWTEEITDCGEYHAKICPKCGVESFIQAHVVSCTNPGSCVTCGAANVSTESLSHVFSNEQYYDETHHWWVCTQCNQKLYVTEHSASCNAPGICASCGAESDKIETSSHDTFDSKIYYDETTHWRVCKRCGEKGYANKHYEYCNETNGLCYECGHGGTIEILHQALKVGFETDEAEHWKVCAVCNEAVNKVAHADSDNDGKCDECGYTLIHTHTWGDPVTVAATCASAGSKTATCTTCGEKTVETIPATGKHTWGEPVTVEPTCVGAGSKTTACTACGEKTVETIPASGEHSWETVSKIYATCTKAGRTERVCTVCDELSITTQGAKGHAYSLVFITQGNGTHAKTCADCGAKHVEDCILTSTEMGDMVCSACATCGYAVYTMTDVALEEVEGLNDATAEIEVKLVENVSFELVAEPAEEGAESEAEAAEITDVVLVVHETQLEMTVELPDTVNASVKKVLAVSMLKEGSAIQPSGKVKLSIPVVEEEVTGMKLVLMGEDGELVEIEYEIIDGVIVFETDMVGIFLFVEAEA